MPNVSSGLLKVCPAAPARWPERNSNCDRGRNNSSAPFTRPTRPAIGLCEPLCCRSAEATARPHWQLRWRLAHIAGPESESRGEVYSAANDRWQASRIFSEVSAMVERVPWLSARVSIRRHSKELEDIGKTGTVYAALSRESGTKHGLSPSFVIYDELGQSRRPRPVRCLGYGTGQTRSTVDDGDKHTSRT